VTVGVNGGVGELHLAVCRRFGNAVQSADGKWDCVSPCDGWDARAVLEHVIGFHDVLILRPLGLKPERPREDPQRRWDSTLLRLHEAFEREGLFDRVISVPGVGKNSAIKMDARTVVPRLTQDVLVHTWDLARAVGADDRLDHRWCAMFLDGMPQPNKLSASGMFAAPVTVGAQADPQTKLLARLGRDPAWRSPQAS
jgi:uncharacterized protein (TIGR03086 family)